MKALSSIVLVLAICAAALVPSSAAADKSLENLFGDVTYQQGTAAALPVAPHVRVAIADSDFAITGVNSQAAITLPDSSRVLVGQNTRVQLALFDGQPDIATARFILVQGKMRFKVEHPSGAKASYTFQTSTGQIAVRGTEGDISTSQTQLQVNVYSLGDPSLPVQVNLTNGKSFTLGAGQSLVVGLAAGAIVSAAVSAISQPLAEPFHEFGPASTVAKAAAALSGGAVAAIGAAAVGGVVAATSSHGTSHGGIHVTPTPTPSPSASPSTSPSPPPGQLVVTPSSLTFTAPGQTQTLVARQSHYTGGFAATGGSPQVSFLQTGNSFAVTSKAAGTSSIIVVGAGGTSPVTVPVDVESGNVGLTPSSLAFSSANQQLPFTASEKGYSGVFTITGGSSIVSFNTMTSTGSFMATSVRNGSATYTITDANSNKAMLTVQVLTGPIVLAPATLAFNKFGQTKTFIASESTFTGSFSATSLDPLSVSVTSPSTGVFTVTALKNTAGVNIRVDDGAPWHHTTIETVTVNTPSPAPSTTCVPIIIHDKHGKLHDHTAATPCPSAPPAIAIPAPRGTVSPPRPHPLGPPPPSGATPKPETTPRPMLTPPGNGPHPGGPSIPGMMTPPPLPGPPGR